MLVTLNGLGLTLENQKLYGVNALPIGEEQRSKDLTCEGCKIKPSLRTPKKGQHFGIFRLMNNPNIKFHLHRSPREYQLSIFSCEGLILSLQGSHQVFFLQSAI